MEEEEKIKNEIREWLNQNRGYLPLSIDAWDITVVKRLPSSKAFKPLTLGKYNGALYLMHSFYKPVSRTTTIKNNDK